jgi:uncharacterized heparinase superfamily protein
MNPRSAGLDAHSLGHLGRLWRTLRWLKPTQITGRARFALLRPQPDLRPAPPLLHATGPWQRPAARDASLVGPTRWQLLAEEHELADIGWDDPALPLLWRYHQHYFDDLNAHDAAARRAWHVALIERWLAANPPGCGTAWAPYPTSLRIVNWIKWQLSGGVLSADALHSLAVQARWLSRRLEWHLLGNHLFANAKALLFAGLFFEGPQADRWRDDGTRILERELAEQVLADGGHFERSPMYHALALEDVLDLLNLLAVFAPAAPLAPALRTAAASMRPWWQCLRHPNGAMVRFNDCAEGIAPSAAEIERYADALGITASSAPAQGVTCLAASGYVRVACGPALAFLDVAPIGPDYLPGHAHADTLSFELSLHGRELIVNRGTSVYGIGPQRQAERGTAAHSTVALGQLDSSEVWAGFRVGRRARASGPQIDGWNVQGSHDGYAHLRGQPRHERRWQFEPNGLQVFDRLPAVPSAGDAVARFHLSPGLVLEPQRADAWRVLDGGRVLARIDVRVGRASAASTPHALRFGVRVDAPTLDVALQDGCSDVRFTWADG